MRFVIKILAVCILSGIATASCAREARVTVIDGDTLRKGDERLRIENLDAPDIGSHAKCPKERQRGTDAKSYAISLIRNARAIDVIWAGRRDRYDRQLVHVMVDGRDFAGLMVSAGYGRPWRGRSSNWCV